MKYLKHIILFLLIIISVLWIEAAHADMSAPEIREFEIVVINPDGVDYYNYKGEIVGHLNKDETVIVLYEYSGTYSIGRKKTNEYGREVNDEIGNIKSLDGFSIVQKEVDPTTITDDKSITKYDTSKKARVYDSNGVDIYKGPSSVYEKVGHIKKDEVLSYNYAVESTAGGTTHIYVEYNGVKGWIEILKSKVLIENDTQYIFSKDVETKCGVIPKNSITTPLYKTDSWSKNALFEYNGCEFIHNTFRDDDIYSIYSFGEVTAVDVTLYEYADNTSNALIIIPAGSEVIHLASKGSLGDPNYTIYLKYNDTVGWAIGEGEIFDYNKKPTIKEDDVKIDDTIKIDEKNEEKKPSKIDTKKSMSLIELIILCSMGGVLLIITAIVVIILVNKNKKEKTKVENITPEELKDEK